MQKSVKMFTRFLVLLEPFHSLNIIYYYSSALIEIIVNNKVFVNYLDSRTKR